MCAAGRGHEIFKNGSTFIADDACLKKCVDISELNLEHIAQPCLDFGFSRSICHSTARIVTIVSCIKT